MEVFMCYMKRGMRPKKRHLTLEAAVEEAKRLAALPDCSGPVFVLADVEIIMPIKAEPVVPVVKVKKSRAVKA